MVRQSKSIDNILNAKTILIKYRDEIKRANSTFSKKVSEPILRNILNDCKSKRRSILRYIKRVDWKNYLKIPVTRARRLKEKKQQTKNKLNH